jgi:hypothetical protein
VTASADARNQDAVGIVWRFSLEHARSTLTHLYPVPDDAT